MSHMLLWILDFIDRCLDVVHRGDDMSVLGVNVESLLLELSEMLIGWRPVDLGLIVSDFFNLLRQSLHDCGVSNIVLIVVDLNNVLSTDGFLIGLVDIDI